MSDTILEKGARLTLDGDRRIAEINMEWKTRTSVLLGAFCMLADGRYGCVSSRHGEKGDIGIFPYAELENEKLQDNPSREILRFDTGPLKAKGFQSLLFASNQTPWRDLDLSIKIRKPTGELTTAKLDHPCDFPVLAIGYIEWQSAPPTITLTETYHQSITDMLRAYRWPES